MDLYIVITACILIFGTLLYRYILSDHHNTSAMPGPKGYPVVGSALELKTGHIHEQFYAYARKYGNMFTIQIFGGKILVLNTVDLINKAFGRDGNIFNNRPNSFATSFINIQESISFRNPDNVHRSLRKLFAQGLHVYGDGVSKFEQVVKNEIGRLLGQLEGFGQQEIEVTCLIRRSLMNVMSILLIGEEATDADVDQFDKYSRGNAFFDALTETVLSYMPVLRHLPYYQRQTNIVKQAKQELMKKYFYDVKDSRKPGTIHGLVEWFLSNQQQNGEVLTDNIIHTVSLVDVFTAGIVTTSSLLPSIILCLAHHPGYQKTLQEELARVIGDNKEPSVSDRHDCPFTEAVTMEALRYITPVPFLLPHACSEDSEFEGYQVKANTQVFGNVWYIHHDEDIWGDPWVFRPERFLDDNGNLLQNDHIYMKSLMPFGTGRRRCPGMGIATTRIFLYLSSVFQKWSFVPVPGKCGSCDPRVGDFLFELVLKPQPFYCFAKRRV